VANFFPKRIPDENSPPTNGAVTTSSGGVNEISKRLLGENGSDAQGVGDWIRTHAYWKTFFLYPQDRLQATGVGAAVVTIEACMELPDDPADRDNAAFVVLATLDSTTRSFSTEVPWRYFRARVTTAAAFAVQVGLDGQGGG
jgi:hypothetical protein